MHIYTYIHTYIYIHTYVPSPMLTLSMILILSPAKKTHTCTYLIIQDYTYIHTYRRTTQTYTFANAYSNHTSHPAPMTSPAKRGARPLRFRKPLFNLCHAKTKSGMNFN